MASPTLQDSTSQPTHEEEEEEVQGMQWDALEGTLDRVVDELLARDMQQQPFAQGKLIPRHDYISLYQEIYNFMSKERSVADKYGNQLYEKYKQLVQRSIHTIFQIQVKLEKKKGASVGFLAQDINLVGKGEEGLEAFLEKVKAFKQKMHVFSHTFSYMERYFIPRKSLPTLQEVANIQLNEQVLKRATHQLKYELATLVDKRRDGKPINDSLMLEVVALFLEINATTTSTNQVKEGEGKVVGAYEDLEAFLLHKTTLYYAKKAPHWPQDTLEKQVTRALQYERDFVQKFLLKKSLSKFEEALGKAFEGIVATRNLQRDAKKMSINFNNANAASLNCSIDLKIQDSTKNSIVDAFRTTNV